MAKASLVIVERDEDYLVPLEVKLAEILRDSVEIEIISDLSYFDEYFTNPRKIDVLVIDDEVYSDRLHMHNIDKTYILTEDLDITESQSREAGEIEYLYKYCNLNVLIDRIIPSGWGGNVSKTREPRIISVISPAGGTGSTTIAMGISACMKQNMKRVLYLNAANYQNFQFLLKNKNTLPFEACVELQKSDERLYEKIKPYFQKEEFAYLPPLNSSRESINISDTAYTHVARAAKQSKDFDFIVMDIGNGLSAEMLRFLSSSDKVFVILKQDAYTAFKMRNFRRSVNCDDADKFVMVCNCYEKEQANLLVSDSLGNNLVVNSYVGKHEEAAGGGCSAMAEMDDMQKLAYMLI